MQIRGDTSNLIYTNSRDMSRRHHRFFEVRVNRLTRITILIVLLQDMLIGRILEQNTYLLKTRNNSSTYNLYLFDSVCRDLVILTHTAQHPTLSHQRLMQECSPKMREWISLMSYKSDAKYDAYLN